MIGRWVGGPVVVSVVSIHGREVIVELFGSMIIQTTRGVFCDLRRFRRIVFERTNVLLTIDRDAEWRDDARRALSCSEDRRTFVAYPSPEAAVEIILAKLRGGRTA